MGLGGAAVDVATTPGVTQDEQIPNLYHDRLGNTYFKDKHGNFVLQQPIGPQQQSQPTAQGTAPEAVNAPEATPAPAAQETQPTDGVDIMPEGQQQDIEQEPGQNAEQSARVHDASFTREMVGKIADAIGVTVHDATPEQLEEEYKVVAARKGISLEDAKKKLEILTDPQSIWHTLTGAVLIADNQIKEASEFSAKASGKQKIDFSLTKDETELFSSLLEAAYARRNAADGSDSEELISDINYYLHTRGVETEDCSKENEKRFELLPARRSGTIRPALVSNGKLLKKGLASVSEG
jgi:hypothetical protein